MKLRVAYNNWVLSYPYHSIFIYIYVYFVLYIYTYDYMICSLIDIWYAVWLSVTWPLQVPSITPQPCWSASGIYCFASNAFFQTNASYLSCLMCWCNLSFIGAILEGLGNFSPQHFSNRTSLILDFWNP